MIRYFLSLIAFLVLLLPEVVAQPEINVQSNATNVVDGSVSPSVGNNTDFGTLVCPNTMAPTFTIQNTGSSALTISGISVSGADAGSFSVSGISFPATINAGGGSLFSITFIKTGFSGVRNATITIANDDADEASYDFAIQATESSPVNLSASVSSNYNGQDISCNGTSDGLVTATPSGGSGGYSYVWSANAGLQTAGNATGLPAGTYSVTVTDATNCHAFASVTVTEPTAVTTTINAQGNVLCFGDATGFAMAAASGGTGGYSFLWNMGQVAAVATGLAAGSYAVTAVDVNGCSSVANVTITQPATAVTASISAQTNVTCNGGNNGTATVVASGGTAFYTVLWGPTMQTAFTATNLAAGTHTATVTDANNCSATASVNITQPGLITISPNVNHVLCNGQSNGSISLFVIGGTSPYNYAWSNGLPPLSTQSNLAAGSYSVTVTDVNGCTASANISIMQPTPLVASIQSTSPAMCNGGNDGSAQVTANGGTPAYWWQWDAATGNVTTAIATGLSAGSYTVTVTDMNGCVSTTTATITEPTAITLTISPTTAICQGTAMGVATSNGSGGVTPYMYLWGASTGFQNSITATGLSAGVHSVTYTDANNCTASASVTITEYPAITVTCAPTDASCNGDNDGSVQANASGGAGFYTYLWSDASIANPNTNLVAGSYTVTITDANGCTASASGTVNEPPAIVPNLVITDISCFGANDGEATVNPTGGTGSGYSFAWYQGASTQTITNLLPGAGQVWVSDGSGCFTSQNFTILEPSLLVVDAGADVTIEQGNAASLQALANGGTCCYLYNWSPSAGLSANNIANPLAAPSATTEYIVSVLDLNACTAADTVTVFVVLFNNDTITTDIAPLNAALNGCLPLQSANPLTYSVTCAPQYGTFNMTTDSCYQYISNGIDANVVDTVCVEVCDGAICGLFTLYIPVASCVWAGDADTNLVVNNFDLLPIGLGMGEMGNIRPNASTNYDCQPVFDWASSTPTTNINYKHSDTDGDGIITNDDTLAITLNWGLTHLRNGGGATGDIPLYLDTTGCNCPLVPGQIVTYAIMLGDMTFPVNDGYGFAFTLNYNPTQVDTASMQIDFNSNWLGDKATGEVLALQRDFYADGQIQAAITRTNGQGVNGFGQIGTMQFTIKDDILRQNFVELEMAFTNVRLITAQNIELGSNPLPIELTVTDTLSSNNPILLQNEVAVFPNPNNGYFVVQTSANIESLTLFNALGQMVHQSNNNSRELNLQGVLPEGVYMLHIQTDKGLVVKQLSIRL